VTSHTTPPNRHAKRNSPDVNSLHESPATAPQAREGSERRSLAPSHKQALARGRSEAAIVNRYLLALGTTKRRGRPISKERMTTRVDAAHQQLAASTGLAKLLAAQELRDLEHALSEIRQRDPANLRSLEAAFVRVAARFSVRRGISYGAWREVGVPAAILQRAKIRRGTSQTRSAE